MQTRVLTLASEVGELMKVVKAKDYGTKAFAVTRDFRDELGDVMADLALLAEAAGVNLGACAESTVAKMRLRLAAHGSVGIRTQ